MWKTLICLTVLDTNRSVKKCRINSIEYTESVCFSSKVMLYRKTNYLFSCSKLAVWTRFRP